MNPVPAYSSERRTAVVLCGTGTHGAYHAGVLKGLHEAGLRIDVYAGHGIGAASATMAAIGGAARLWEADGFWRPDQAGRLYGWQWPVRAIGLAFVLVCALLAVPAAALALGLLAIPAGYAVQMVAPDAGQALFTAYGRLIEGLFAPAVLPTIIPRLVTLVLLLLAATLGVDVIRGRWRPERRRRTRGGWWWHLAGAPIDAAGAGHAAVAAIGQLVRGAAADDRPETAVMGRRVADVLAESLGQPGFGELVLAVTDLDAREDLVAALIRPQNRGDLFARASAGSRSRVDLSGDGGALLLDVVAAALRPPLWCDPAAVVFPAASYWRGEMHRCCDRPGLISRLLEEVAAAGVTQVIVVAGSTAVDGPHRLVAPALDVRGRLGAFHAAAEAVALTDALAMARLRFDAVHVVAPAHNAIGPFDMRGAHDPASDRVVAVAELVAMGYEDAHRQFIDPVMGASGEHLDGSGVESDVRFPAPGLASD